MFPQLRSAFVCFLGFIQINSFAADSITWKVVESVSEVTFDKNQPSGPALLLPRSAEAWLKALSDEEKDLSARAIVELQKSSQSGTHVTLVRQQGVFVMELFVELHGAFEEYATIADQPEQYNAWVFDEINTAEDGSRFLVTLFPLISVADARDVGQKRTRCASQARALPITSAEQGYPSTVSLPYSFQFLAFQKDSKTQLRSTCGTSKLRWQEWNVEVRPGSLIQSATARNILFSPDGRKTYGIVLSHTKPSRWVYEILPLVLVRKQTGQRISIVLRNMEKRRAKIFPKSPAAQGGEAVK